jgi:hypothetical protein
MKIQKQSFIVVEEMKNNNNLYSKVDLPDYANDTKAESYINKNLNSSNKSLEATLLNTTKEIKANSFCSISGIGLDIIKHKELSLCSIKVEIDSSSLISLSSSASREFLYSLSLNTLAGIVLTTYTSKNLLRSTDNNALLSNTILSSAGKANLVESIILYNLISFSNIDTDTLPKLDITLATHYEGITSFEQPLSSYLSILKTSIEEQTLSEEQKRIQLRREREELAILARQKAESKKNKNLESTYEIKRKLASNALKDSMIDLYYLNYKKLSEVLTILVSRNGSSMKIELKEKVLLRLNEIISKYSKEDSSENKDLLKNIATIKDFVILSLTERVNKIVESNLERVSELSSNNNTKLSLKERIALAKSKIGKAE